VWIAPRRTAGLGAGLAAALALVAGALRFGPAVMLSLSLAAPATEGWLSPVLAQPVREEIVVASPTRRIPADLYRPAAPRAALVIVHGLSRAGRRHPEIVRLARLLGQHGQLVLVPQLDGLASFALQGGEVDDIRAALRDLAARGHPVGIVGFSFGAGPALLAAADAPDLRVVGSFGGYAELVNVIAYVTTGVHTFQGRRYVQRQEEYNRWKLLALLAGILDGEADRRAVGAIAVRRLANPGDDTRALEAGLGPDGRAVLRVTLNRDERAVMPLLAALSPGTRQMLERMSPLASVPRLRSRLLVAHGEADDSIPFTESYRLAEAAGDRAQLAILHTFHHTGPQPVWRSLSDRVGDGWSLMRLVDALL
jgi:pimeloyl-ACP methyl ester carboxylesterase